MGQSDDSEEVAGNPRDMLDFYGAATEQVDDWAAEVSELQAALDTLRSAMQDVPESFAVSIPSYELMLDGVTKDQQHLDRFVKDVAHDLLRAGGYGQALASSQRRGHDFTPPDQVITADADDIDAGPADRWEAMDETDTVGVGDLPELLADTPYLVWSSAVHLEAAGEPDPVEGDPDRKVDDPTTDGKITARMRNLYTQAAATFPDTDWVCYDARPGTDSEHPLGRACDGTFGNEIGERPTAEQRELGWEVTNWVKDNAETLGVEYLIWDGKIWSPARDDEGWRPYNGGGMHDPDDVTGGHYDHLHITVR